jgi:hypothetical protein
MKEEKSSDFIESRFSVIVYNSLTEKLAEQIESGAELKSRKRIFCPKTGTGGLFCVNTFKV